jgi:adenosylcobinamide-GDP ribazoletransferase
MMKIFFQNLDAAFSMYSRIPMPQIKWTKDSTKYVMCFFPLVGTVIGLIEYLWFFLYALCRFGTLLYASVAVAIPVLVTGGIHMDGFLDTCDALSSWREKSERLRILKDSHVGAYAVIWTAVYFVLAIGLTSEADQKNILPLCAIFMLSRTFSAISVVSPSFPKVNPDGTLANFSNQAEKKTVRIVCMIYLCLIAVFLVMTGRITGILIFISGVVSFFFYRHISMKFFGGTTGDLAGFFVTFSELLMLAGGIIFSHVF